MTNAVRQAAAAVSDKHPGLKPDWLNDDATKLKRVNLPIDPEPIYAGIVDGEQRCFRSSCVTVAGRAATVAVMTAVKDARVSG